MPLLSVFIQLIARHPFTKVFVLCLDQQIRTAELVNISLSFVCPFWVLSLLSYLRALLVRVGCSLLDQASTDPSISVAVISEGFV